jgi:hypothetical protein
MQRLHCVDFCIQSTLKLIYMHILFQKLPRGYAHGPPLNRLGVRRGRGIDGKREGGGKGRKGNVHA